MGVCCWSSSWLCAVPVAMMEQHLSIAALTRVFSLTVRAQQWAKWSSNPDSGLKDFTGKLESIRILCHSHLLWLGRQPTGDLLPSLLPRSRRMVPAPDIACIGCCTGHRQPLNARLAAVGPDSGSRRPVSAPRTGRWSKQGGATNT